MLIGPGDLYTSLVPCLLVDGVAEAIRACEGEVIYVCNVMTKHGETDGFAASDFVREIHHYLGRRVDTVVVNTAEPSAELAARYAEEGAFPVAPDLDGGTSARAASAGRIVCHDGAPHPPRRRTRRRRALAGTRSRLSVSTPRNPGPRSSWRLAPFRW